MVIVNSVRLLGFISYENFQVNVEGGSVWICAGWRIASRGRSGSQARKAEVHQSEPEGLSWFLSTVLLCFSVVQPRIKRRGDAEGSWRYWRQGSIFPCENSVDPYPLSKGKGDNVLLLSV